jgi:hypothetical protein
MGQVDVVVVSFNSRSTLRACVEPVAALPNVNVFVIDNASSDDSLSTLDGLELTALPQCDNGGFSRGCNVGWRAGAAPYVLLLNPDCRLAPEALAALVDAVEADPACGAVGPKIVDDTGHLDYSQRRFPRVLSVLAAALFLHRLLPRASWTDDAIRDESAYDVPSTPEWVSGACMLLRRSALEQLGGLDEGFFLYCEDTDLCKRLRDAGFEIRFEPRAVVQHTGGASAPRPSLFPILIQSRIRYAQLHAGRAAIFHRLAIAFRELTHVIASQGGRAARLGHARGFFAACRPLRTTAGG